MEKTIKSIYRNKNLDFFEKEESIIFYGFSKWILEEAKKKGINRLYFLSRDGYIPYKVCEILKEKYRYNIDLRYLYTSRISSRIPSFYVSNRQDIINYVTINSNKMTLHKIMGRFPGSKEEKNKIIEISNLSVFQNKILTVSEISKIREELSKNEYFFEIINKNCKQKYDVFSKYLIQEGFLDRVSIGIVDSGWSGSTQICFEKVLSSLQREDRIYGLYFGMYCSPKAIKGFYSNYYFNGNNHLFRKLKFNNNFFETMLFAPNPMTIDYKIHGDRVEPIFDIEDEEYHLKEIEKILSSINKLTRINHFGDKQLFRYVKKSLSNLMWKPSKNLLNYYNKILFSDDVTRNESQNIIVKLNKEELKQLTLFRRVKNKLSGKNNCEKIYFFPIGSIYYSDIKHKWFYKLNVFLYDFLREIKNRMF